MFPFKPDPRSPRCPACCASRGPSDAGWPPASSIVGSLMICPSASLVRRRRYAAPTAYLPNVCRDTCRQQPTKTAPPGWIGGAVDGGLVLEGGLPGTIRLTPTRWSGKSLCAGSQAALVHERPRRIRAAFEFEVPMTNARHFKFTARADTAPGECDLNRRAHHEQKPHRDALESQRGPDGYRSKL